MAIIQMPFEPHIPPTYASREDQDYSRVGDVVFHFHSDAEIAGSPSKRKREQPTPEETGIEEPMPQVRKWAEASPQATRVSNLTLALRPQKRVEDTLTDDSASEEEEFRIVRRRTSHVLEETTALLSDDDFDVVQVPGQVEALSSGEDSDTDTVVEVEHTVASSSDSAPALPIRPRGHAAAAVGAEMEPCDSASDSEWDMV